MVKNKKKSRQSDPNFVYFPKGKHTECRFGGLKKKKKKKVDGGGWGWGGGGFG